jgi:hypothetical protein
VTGERGKGFPAFIGAVFARIAERLGDEAQPGRGRGAKVLAGGALAMVAFASAAVHPVCVESAAATPNPIFANVIPALKAQATVPVVLPATVLWDPSTLGTLYASVEHVNSTSYQVTFNTAATCDASSCNEGALLSSVPSGSIDLSNYGSYQTVTLSNGDSACAAIPLYRQATTITWDDTASNRRYELIFPVANFPADLVTMANSMTRY